MKVHKEKLLFKVIIASLLILSVVCYYICCKRYQSIQRRVRSNHTDWRDTRIFFEDFTKIYLPKYSTLREAINAYNKDLTDTIIYQKNDYFVLDLYSDRDAFLAFSEELDILPPKSGRIYTIGYKFKILPYLKKIPPPENLAAKNLREHIERFKEEPLIPSMYEFPKRLWSTIDMLFFGSRFSTRE